jgi:hypothetical protein
MRPFFIFSDVKGELRHGNLMFDSGNRTMYQRGMPTKEDIIAGRGLSYRYCNLLWVTPGFTAICVDYIDMYQLLR